MTELSYHIARIPQVTGGAVTRSAAYEAIRDGRLAARKSGRRTFVMATELQRFLESLPAMGGK